jgi:hypothetical protein
MKIIKIQIRGSEYVSTECFCGPISNSIETSMTTMKKKGGGKMCKEFKKDHTSKANLYQDTKNCLYCVIAHLGVPVTIWSHQF